MGDFADEAEAEWAEALADGRLPAWGSEGGEIDGTEGHGARLRDPMTPPVLPPARSPDSGTSATPGQRRASEPEYEGANNCTIELVHGGTLHLAHSEGETWAMMEQAWLEMCPFFFARRMEGYATRESRGFPFVRVNANHIVGVYPLQTRSDPPRQRDD